MKTSEKVRNALLEWEPYGHYLTLSEKNKALVEEVEQLEKQCERCDPHAVAMGINTKLQEEWEAQQPSSRIKGEHDE